MSSTAVECICGSGCGVTSGLHRKFPLDSNVLTMNFIALYCTALTALQCTTLHCTALHCTALHCTALHCTALHCIALHYTALHCTALQSDYLKLYTVYFALKSAILIQNITGPVITVTARLASSY